MKKLILFAALMTSISTIFAADRTVRTYQGHLASRPWRVTCEINLFSDDQGVTLTFGKLNSLYVSLSREGVKTDSGRKYHDLVMERERNWLSPYIGAAMGPSYTVDVEVVIEGATPVSFKTTLKGGLLETTSVRNRVDLHRI